MPLRDNPFEDFRPSLPQIDWKKLRRYFRLFIIIIVLIFVASVILSSFFTVQANEEAVILRFGKYLDTAGPGLHFRLPLGVDRVLKAEVKTVFTEEFGYRTGRAGVESEIFYDFPLAREESFMLTGDVNCAVVNWAVRWKISDINAYFFNVRDVRKTIRDASSAVMRQLAGDRSIDEVLLKDRVEIQNLAKPMMQQMLDDLQCGIQIVGVMLKRTAPPERVQAAFEEVNQAKQVRDTIINEAEAKRNREIDPAKGKRQRAIESARGYAERRVNEAEGDTKAFLAILEEYEKAKEVTQKRLYLETMSRVLPRCGKIYIIDKKNQGLLQVLQLGTEVGKEQ